MSKGFNGQKLISDVSDQVNQIIVEEGNNIFVAKATPGVSNKEARWSISKINETILGNRTTTTITWANDPVTGKGTARFIHRADQATTLLYS